MACRHGCSLLHPHLSLLHPHTCPETHTHDSCSHGHIGSVCQLQPHPTPFLLVHPNAHSAHTLLTPVVTDTVGLSASYNLTLLVEVWNTTSLSFVYYSAAAGGCMVQ